MTSRSGRAYVRRNVGARRILRSNVALSSLALALLATTAATQPAYAADAAPTDQQAAPPAAAVQEVVVTGSLITRRDFKSDSPISTIGASEIAATGQPSLDRTFAEMPQFSGAQGAAEVGDAQGSLGFAGGQSYSDLRGLGPNRSLVLLDGRRLMASAPDGSIDLNTIPTALVQNVEVITGGASATYGSDAVAGVVNFKLRNNFSGLELNYQHGGTTHGDGATNQVSAIVGGNYADNRGNAVFDFEYSDRAAVDGASRPFFASIRQLARPPEGIIAAGNFGGGAPTVAAVNSVLAGYPGTTPIAGSGAYKGAIGVNTDGTVFTMNAAPNCVQDYKGLGTIKGVNISANCAAVQVALGQYFAVQVPLTKYNVFARSTYNLSDHITAYGQFNFAESSALDQTGPGSSKAAIPLIIPQNSPFVTGNPGLQTILSSISPAPTGPLILTKLMSAFGNRVETFKYTVWQAQAGVKGDIPGTDLTWDVYGSVGRSQFVNNGFGDISRSAINSILGGTASAPGCSGFAWNALGNNPISAACLAYAGRTDHSVNTQTQKLVEGTLQGSVFTLPAGRVKFAVGADYRTTDFNYMPDETLITNDSLSYGSVSAAHGNQNVKELFGELLVPVLKDKPFAEDVSLDLGYRYSKYNTFSGQSTWKADVSWEPVSAVRLRGGYSVAIRAPSLQDLYGPSSTGNLNIGTTPNAGDPCDVNSVFRTGANSAKVQALCAAQGVPGAILPTFTYGSVSVAGSDGSNSKLTPETAKTWSIGVVLAPKFDTPLAENIQLSVDYYNISITNAVGSLQLTDILPRCFNSDGVSNPGYSVNNAYCQRIGRDPLTGDIISGQQGLFNFGAYSLDGVDTQLNWVIGLDELGAGHIAGKLAVNTVVSYLANYRVAGLLGSPTLNYAGSVGFGGVGGDISHPHWKASTAFTYTNGPLSATMRWRFVGAMKHSDLVASPTATTPGVPAYSYVDLDVHYAFSHGVTVGVGVTNLGDKGPPFVSGAPLTTDAATYDVIGRTWFASVKAKF